MRFILSYTMLFVFIFEITGLSFSSAVFADEIDSEETVIVSEEVSETLPITFVEEDVILPSEENPPQISDSVSEELESETEAVLLEEGSEEVIELEEVTEELPLNAVEENEPSQEEEVFLEEAQELNSELGENNEEEPIVNNTQESGSEIVEVPEIEEVISTEEVSSSELDESTLEAEVTDGSDTVLDVEQEASSEVEVDEAEAETETENNEIDSDSSQEFSEEDVVLEEVENISEEVGESTNEQEVIEEAETLEDNNVEEVVQQEPEEIVEVVEVENSMNGDLSITSTSESTEVLSSSELEELKELTVNPEIDTETLEKNMQDILRKNNREDSGLYVEGEILVKFKDDQLDINSISGKAKEFFFAYSYDLEQVEILEKVKNIFRYNLKENEDIYTLISEISTNKNVEYAQPNFIYSQHAIPNDTHFNNLWGISNTGQFIQFEQGVSDADIDALEAWDIAIKNQNTIVSIIDTGVDYHHPDLRNMMWDGSANCKDEEGSTVSGGCMNHGWTYNFYEYDNPLPIISYPGYPPNPHGTHVAGTIAAQVNNNEGVSGVSDAVEIMALNTYLYSSEIVKSINFSKHNAAKVINASWGGVNFSCETAFDQSVYDAIKAFPGLFVSSAGNNASEHITEIFDFPSDYGVTTECWEGLDNVISVASTNNKDELASLSDYGSKSVHIGAPGEAIYSTVISERTYAPIAEYKDDFSGVSLSGNWGVQNGSFDGQDTFLRTDINHFPYTEDVGGIATFPTHDLSNYTNVELKIKMNCDTQDGFSSDYVQLKASKDGINFGFLNRPWVFLNEEDLKILGETGDYSGWKEVEYILPPEYLTSDFSFRFEWIVNGDDDHGTEGGGCLLDDVEILDIHSPIEVTSKYEFFNGTSMAAPHVAGLAGMLMSHSPTSSDAVIKDVILKSGNKISSLAGKTITGKRINAAKAIRYIDYLNTYSNTDLKFYNELLFEHELIGGNIPEFHEDIASATAAITKAELIRGLVLVGGLSMENLPVIQFNDVSSTDWFYDFVRAAVKAGFIQDSSDAFRPFSQVPRDLAASLLMNAYAINFSNFSTPTSLFTDLGSSAFNSEITALYNLSITDGFNGDSTQFQPLENITRDIFYKWLVLGKTVKQDPGAYVRLGNGSSVFSTLSQSEITARFLSALGEEVLTVCTDFEGATRDTALSIDFNSSTSASLCEADTDYFKVETFFPGVLTVGTSSNIDTVGELEDVDGNLLGGNDDNGTDTNFQLIQNIEPGIYFIKVRAFNPSSQGNYTFNSSFIIDENVKQPLLSVVNGNVGADSDVNISVIAENLENVAGIELHMEYDSTQLSFVEFVNNTNLEGATVSENPVGQINIIWDDFENFINISSGPFFDIKFQALGSIDTQSSISFLPTSNIVNSDGVNVHAAYEAGTVSIISALSISGVAHYISQILSGIPQLGLFPGVAGSNAVLTNTSTSETHTAAIGDNGEFSLASAVAQQSYNVALQSTEETTNGVNIGDVIKIRRHLAGIDVFDHQAKCAAADVNNDNTITIGDVIKIRRYLGGLDALTSGDWQFYKNLDFTCSTLSARSAVRTYENISQNQSDQNFTGVRMGDVDFSWSPPQVSQDAQVSIAKSTTLDSRSVVQGSQGVEILEFNVTAGLARDVKINSLRVRIYADDDGTFDNGEGDFSANSLISNITLVANGSTLAGPGDLVLNSIIGVDDGYYYIDFTNLDYTIPAGNIQAFSVAGNIAISLAQTFYLAADVAIQDISVTDSDSNIIIPEGDAHLNNNIFPNPLITIEEQGALSISLALPAQGEGTLVSGSTDNTIAGLSFAALHEPFIIKKLAVSNDYLSVPGDLDNNIAELRLEYTNSQGQTEQKTATLTQSIAEFSDLDIFADIGITEVSLKASLNTLGSGAVAGEYIDLNFAFHNFEAVGQFSAMVLNPESLNDSNADGALSDEILSLGGLEDQSFSNTVTYTNQQDALVGSSILGESVVLNIDNNGTNQEDLSIGALLCFTDAAGDTNCDSSTDDMYIVTNWSNGTTFDTVTAILINDSGNGAYDAGDEILYALPGKQYFTELNRQYVFETKPTLSLSPSSPTGSRTVSAIDELFVFDVAADSNERVQIRQAQELSSCIAGNSKVSIESDVHTTTSEQVDGSGCKVNSIAAANDFVAFAGDNLQNYAYGSFWIRWVDSQSIDSSSFRVSDIAIGTNSDNTSSPDQITRLSSANILGNPTTLLEGKWYHVYDVALPRGTDTFDSHFNIIFKRANSSGPNNLNDEVFLDKVVLYNDKITLQLESLGDFDADVNSDFNHEDEVPLLANLKEGGSVVASGYISNDSYSSSTSDASHAIVHFYPLAGVSGAIEIAQGTSKRFSFETDTSALLDEDSNVDDPLHVYINYGSSVNGSISAGDFWWNDTNFSNERNGGGSSYNLLQRNTGIIRWVDAEGTRLNGNTLSY